MIHGWSSTLIVGVTLLIYQISCPFGTNLCQIRCSSYCWLTQEIYYIYPEHRFTAIPPHVLMCLCLPQNFRLRAIMLVGRSTQLASLENLILKKMPLSIIAWVIYKVSTTNISDIFVIIDWSSILIVRVIYRINIVNLSNKLPF